jgi:hypothetical protein
LDRREACGLDFFHVTSIQRHALRENEVNRNYATHGSNPVAGFCCTSNDATGSIVDASARLKAFRGAYGGLVAANHLGSERLTHQGIAGERFVSSQYGPGAHPKCIKAPSLRPGQLSSDA